MSDINAEIDRRIQEFVQDISGLVRQAALDAVGEALGGKKPGAARAHGGGAATSHGPGAKRSPQQIKKTVDAVLAFIKAHPNSKAEVIRQQLSLRRPLLQDALNRLKAKKAVKAKGVKRGTTYAAA